MPTGQQRVDEGGTMRMLNSDPHREFTLVRAMGGGGGGQMRSQILESSPLVKDKY